MLLKIKLDTGGEVQLQIAFELEIACKSEVKNFFKLNFNLFMRTIFRNLLLSRFGWQRIC